MQDKKMSDRRMYTSRQRRAMNIIWTASGEYDFQPDFMAFQLDGEPDFYMNSIIGYVRKWYDPDIMEQLFSTIQEGLFKETYDGLLWIALENCAFQREVPHRPVLEELRLEHALDFFRQDDQKSRQQWMAQNSLVYALESAKWRQVLGKEPGLVNPWERQLFKDLLYPGDITSQEIYDRTLEIFHRYFRYRRDHLFSGFFSGIRERFRHHFFQRLPRRLIRSDDLNMGRIGSVQGSITPRQGMELLPKKPSESAADYQYIQNCFGLPLYPEEVSLQLENLLCTDAHENCRLYFTDGKLPAQEEKNALVQKFLRDSEAQRQKNESYYQNRRDFCQSSIHHLTQQIKNAMLVYPQPLKIPSRSGKIFPREVWKALWLDDDRIFMETTDEEQPDFSVDLMLDASASRLGSQEIIALQGYIIAESLQKCGIPFQVYSFLSLKGFTVIRHFLSYEDKDRNTEIFGYCAAGWNRDGLAFRGAGHLLESSPAANRILMVLTDASPNDDRRIPADPSKGRVLSQDYSGKPGIEDTAREVHVLKQKGVKVMAILNGSDADTLAASRIYQQDYVRIEKPDQLSQAAGVLIQKQIQQLHS